MIGCIIIHNQDYAGLVAFSDFPDFYTGLRFQSFYFLLFAQYRFFAGFIRLEFRLEVQLYSNLIQIQA